MEINRGDIYIVKGKQPGNRDSYYKFKVIELTQHTILLENMDANFKFRISITDFKTRYEILETIVESIKGTFF